MSPGSEAEESGKEKNAGSPDQEHERIPLSASKAPAKRRTKSGCMTCRKRRIKCGEEKPFCKNCIKSKRECAGYSQPLVYKQHNQGGRPVPQDDAEVHLLRGHEHFSFNEAINPTHGHRRPPHEYFNPFGSYPHQSVASSTHGSIPMPYSQPYPTPTTEHPYVTTTPITFDEQHRRHSMQEQPTHYFAYGGVQYPSRLHRQGEEWSGRQQSFNSSESGVHQYPEVSPTSHLTSPFDSYTPAPAGYFPSDSAHLHDNYPRRYSALGFVQPSPYATAFPTLNGPRDPFASADPDFEDPDDPWDVEMEEQYDGSTSEQQTQQGLSEMLARKNAHLAGSTRSLIKDQASAALQAAYHPVNLSPLSDERNERVFCHFVEVTSICMTIFERGPSDPLLQPHRTTWSFALSSAAMTHPALAHAILALAGLHVAKLRDTSEDPALKHFTYALRRTNKLLGLPTRRHEITTLATVLLLGFYEVMSADHSRWNLHLEGAKNLIMEQDFAGMTRMARRMRYQAKQRIDHFGQQVVVPEIDYVKVAGIPEILLDDEDWEVDQAMLSILTGFAIDYDKHLQPNFPKEYAGIDLTEKDVADYKIRMDLRWWYCKQDVFQSMVSGDSLLMPWSWWKFCPPRGRIGNASIPYATFDHLLLLLGRLTNFGGKDRQRKIRVVGAQGGQWRPPPGFNPSGHPPHGKAPDKHPKPGTSALSVGRDKGQSVKEDFRSDKTKVSAPSANEGRVRQTKAPTQAPSFQGGPPMYGMMPPPPANISMHSSFRAMEDTIKDKAFALPQLEVKTDLSQQSLEEETTRALQEHKAIARAFNAFSKALGPDFQPLSAEDDVAQTSPFGPPLRFRSPAIACIWLHYNVGKILLHRLHPHMPPAAMIAAGVAAQQTKEYAQNIGKICASLYQSTSGGGNDRLDPGFAGGLIESTFPLLFAGVQYQEMAQRGWTISKLHDIARMTGWQTSAAVAAACEIAWERQGLAGRGPPYQRSLDRNNKDARVNGASRLADTGTAIVEAADAVSEHESQFVSHDRNLIGKHGSTRVHWALGLLGVEKDIEKLELNDM